MKFACGECQAKYQIPDERVAGRKLKIRCRKCGAAISLRGDPTVEGIAGLAPASAKSSVEWHVSIEGDQHGPYTTDQMAGMLRSSQLDWEAYVWREGYGDWKTADTSDTIVRAVASLGSSGSDAVTPTAGIAPYEDDDGPTRMKPAPDEDEQPTRMAVNAPVIAQHPQHDFDTDEVTTHALQSQPPTVQSQALQPQARSAFAHRAASVRAYGSAPPHVYASQPPALPQAGNGANVRQLPVTRSPRVSAAQAMTAERNEDSVLFSANNLVPSSQQMPAQRAGYASQEGSGLIDIRALAALAHSHRTPLAAQPTAREAFVARAEEPLPAIAHQAGTFSRIDSLSPFERPQQRTSNAVPISIVAGAAMIAVALFLGVYLTQQPASTPSAVVAEPANDTAAAAQPTDDTLPTAAEAETAVPADAPEGKANELAAAVAPQDEPAAKDEPAPDSASRSRGKVRPAALARGTSRAPKQTAEEKIDKVEKTDKVEKADKGSAAAKAVAEEPEPLAEKEKPSIDDLLLDDAKPAAVAAAEPAKAKPAPSGPRDIDSLMNGAVPVKGAAAGAAAPAGDSSLPETPSRDDVFSAMRAVTADVKSCAEGQTLTDNVATVALTVIGATGRVQSVRVTGNPGVVGTCIARAVRAATFPKFSKVQQTINFPFKLQ
jgi:predicted Zn finger-like uncharacterized protein